MGCVTSQTKCAKTAPHVDEINRTTAPRIMAPKAPTLAATPEKETELLPNSLRKLSLFVVGEEASALEESAIPPAISASQLSNQVRTQLQPDPRISIS
ncbi:unnamed protein product [Blepharisma stoltei]|uniref:Uncharacterized protein n=1 Tax=Blepharisma stoltei TaxID=1481888 RepID=A0AAU9JN99_9CILI|nr:unnamed protein product [Blepharisma stoltei]